MIKLERRAVEVLYGFPLVRTWEQELEGYLMGTASVISQFTDGNIVGVSHFEPFVLHSEHHDESVHVVVGNRLGDGIAKGVNTHELLTFIGKTVAEPQADGERIEIEIAPFTEIVEILLMLEDEVRTDGDVAERGFLLTFALQIEIAADMGSPFHGTIVVGIFQTI